MRWKGRTGSGNVSTSGGGKGMAIGGVGVAILIIYTLITGDPSALLNNLFNGGNTSKLSEARQTELTEFVSVVLADTETVWTEVFRQNDMEYTKPYLIIFSGSVDSACGTATTAVGPFYCPGDQKVYIDLEFFDELETRFKAPGDFAMAYVIAHEVGHHVQYLLGTMEQMDKLRQQLSETEYNKLSVKLELQADYNAGVFAKYEQGAGYLEAGDVEEALTAAAAVGDDRIQKETQGTIVPDSFTHGTSAQRMRWFKLGMQYGDFDHGDTFNAKTLAIQK
ncbi:MAG: neutral zinc metallopeptidase [Erysipelotrichaceae bacterium]